ncbi:MAG TPA: hypothetical protein DHU55_17660 [Blastocatellia bacterium]|jgi:hypothetical protein|nr:hypothetical protein [Blastocatellia bacterium]HCX31574.1 hypothetical protein [Blastocatellia bacterium]
MQMSDIRNPDERKKLIWAGVLGMLAILLLWWTFFGFGGNSTRTTPRANSQPTPSAVTRTTGNKVPPSAVDVTAGLLDQLRPVNSEFASVSVPEARRNIFVYYEPPTKPVAVASVPTPTPTPTPPVLLASISPANVYARTGDFTLEISGDKFTPQMRVVVDNSEVPTRYLGPQQVSATVAAAVIANPGARQVMLRSPDGKLYSNAATLNIAAPPTPNYSYVGIIGTVHHIDTAILQDKGSKETLNVQRGDLLGGRFRVTSISEKELVLVDTNLKVKHSLPMSNQGEKGNPLQRPTPRVDSEDDEP